MSKQKQLRNRLNDLFADMGEEQTRISKDQKELSGWTWECDSNRLYTACSPEVKEILGLEASVFVGESLTSFQLTSASSKTLTETLESNGDPTLEITLHFQSDTGEIIPIRTYIFRQSTDGLKGFSQVLEDATELEGEETPEEQAIPEAPVPPIPSITTRWQDKSETLGVALDDERAITISSPYSGAGKQSLKRQRTISNPAAPGIEAALAVPIQMPDKRLGLLEIIDDAPQRDWTDDESRLVEEVVDQLSLALENARLFEETQISLSRTEALFEVSRSAIAVEDIKSLMQNVVDTISAVLPAHRALLYQFTPERREVLAAFESNAPQIPITERLVEQIFDGLSGWVIRERKPALSLKGTSDPRESDDAQRHRIQVNAGSLAVVPLIYRDQILGTITAINSLNQPDFTQSDVDLLMAMANQVATALANANILAQEQHRRQIASTLSEIARVVSGSLDLNRIAKRLLNQLAEIVEFNAASLQIIEGNQRQQIGGIDKRKKGEENAMPKLLRPVSEDPLLRTVIESREPLLVPDTQTSTIWERFPDNAHVRSWIAAPLLRDNSVIGLLVLDHNIPNVYDEETADLLSAIAAQAAVAIHNARLYQQAEARSTQLQTAAEVSRAASSILDPNPLIEQTVNLIRDRFDLYYVGLFMIDQTGTITHEPSRWAVLRAGTGDAGRIQVERNHKLEVGGTSMIGQCIATAEPQISQQIESEERRYVNPLLPETRSEMALPLISRGEVVGAMTIQHTQTAAFSEEDITILQTMADQVANALQNASLFDQIQIRAEELAVLNEMSRQLTATVDINAISRNIYLFTSRLIDTSTFFIGLYDDATNQISFPLAIEDNQEITLPARPKGRGLTEFVIDSREPLFIQQDIAGWLVQQDVEFFPLGKESETQIAESWLGVPMLAGETVIGVIGVQHYDSHHYTEQDYDLLVAIASQSAIAFQNASLFAETRQRTEDLAILNEMSRVLANLLDINMVNSTVFEFTSKLMDATNFFIALYDSDTQEITMPLVSINHERLEIPKRKLGTALSDYVIRNHQPLLLNGDVLKQQEKLGIERHPVGKGLPPKSWLGVPMMIGERVIGVISVQSLTTPYLYMERERDLLASIASQVAITIQNTRLFDQTQQQLADLMAIQQTTTELSAAITLDDVIHTLLENLIISVQADSISMFILQENNLIRMGVYPPVEDEGIIGETISLDDYPLTKNVIETRRSLVLSADDPRLQEQARLAFKTSGITANMTVPLIGPEGALGTLSLNRNHPALIFNQQEVNLLETLANQAAISLQNARLFEQIQQRSEELQLINQVVSRVAASLNLNESLDIVINEIGRVVNAASGGVTILNKERQALILMADYLPHAGMPSAVGLELPLENNPASVKIIETRQSLIIDDPQNNPLTAAILEPMRQRGIETILLFPLIVGGEVIGTIGLDFIEKNRTLTRSESRLVETIILQTATAIENARLFGQTRRQLRDLTTISNASQELASAPLESTDVAEIIVRIFIEIIGGESIASISLLDTTAINRLKTVVSLRSSGGKIEFEDDLDQWGFSLDDFPATARVMQEIKPLVIQVDDPDADAKELEYMLREDVKTLIIIPLAAKGQANGVIELECLNQANYISTEELNLALTLANQAAITLENARLYEEQRETAEQLREVDTLKSQFLANMSHELRTPLNSIIGFSRVIMKGIDGPVTELQHQDLSAIYNAGQHLLYMINDILDISKIEAGKMDLAFDDVDITEILESVLSTARGLVKDKPVQLITDIDEDIPIITADPTRVRQILLNLISNAAKFTDEGCITVTARKQASKFLGEEILISVNDTGTGIAEEDQYKLFVPFSQVDGSPTRKVGGTGLGLSITRLLVELHGGEIGVDSTEGEGSTFWFTLPIPETLSHVDADGKRIVIAIDDDAQVIGLYERYLSSAGYKVVPVTNPNEAIKKIHLTMPYAITLDIMMPDFDGWKLLEDIKADSDISHIPIVICSILSECDKGMELGASDYLTKPILEDDLVRALNKLKNEEE